MTLPQVAAFSIVVVMMALFAWGRWRYDLVAAGALLAAVIVGVVPPDQAFEGFSDDIVIIVGSALVVSAAVARSGVIERTARWLGPYLTTINRQILALVGSKVLPSVTRIRRVGLITYGPTRNPGLFNQCDNIELNVSPMPNAAARIMASVQSLVPIGGTPLTLAVEQGAEVLDFRSKPGVIVVLTDGEDTCGGSPCRVGAALHAAAAQLTIHVIGLQMEGSIAGSRCIADQNGGLYLTPQTTDDLIAALEKTLGCPMVSRYGAN